MSHDDAQESPEPVLTEWRVTQIFTACLFKNRELGANNDKVEGRSWTKRAEEVPPTIAWVKVEQTWVPVVRIEITGTAERREITKFGPDGRVLERTIQAPRSERRDDAE